MRIVIKIGTSTLAHHTGRLNIRRTEVLCKVISDLKMPDMKLSWSHLVPLVWVPASFH